MHFQQRNSCLQLVTTHAQHRQAVTLFSNTCSCQRALEVSVLDITPAAALIYEIQHEGAAWISPAQAIASIEALQCGLIYFI